MQVIPHITDEIKECIRAVSDGVDVVIVEIGGTVGDIECLPFLEAIRQFRQDVGRENSLYIHLTLVPYIEAAGELKTKPTQHRSATCGRSASSPTSCSAAPTGILPRDMKQKIALFCNVDEEAVIAARDVSTSTRCRWCSAEEASTASCSSSCSLPNEPTSRHGAVGRAASSASSTRSDEVTIGVVGKYVGYEDAYKSLNEALDHGGIAPR